MTGHTHMRNKYRFLVIGVVAAVAVSVVLLAGSVELPASVAQSQDIAWVRQFGTAGDEGATSIALSPQGDIGVVGWTDGVLAGQASSGGRDAFVRKFGPDGSLAWSHQFGTRGADNAMAVDFDAASDLLVAGQVRGALPGQTQTGPADAFLRKYAPDGTAQWTDQFGVTGESAAARLDAHSATSVFVGGWVYGPLPGQTWLGQYDAFVREYTSGGSLVATTQFGTAQHDRVENLLAPLGTIFAVTASDRPASSNQRRDKKDHFLQVFDRATTRLKTKQKMPLGDTDELTAVLVTTAGELVVVGQQEAEHGHAFVAKIDVQDRQAWLRPIQITGNDVATAVALDGSGAVYVAGNTGPTNASSAGDVTVIWVEKFASDGTPVWTRQEGSGKKDVVSSLAVTKDGTVYLAGWTTGAFPSQSSTGRSDAFVLRLTS
jgi:hypothetical protein